MKSTNPLFVLLTLVCCAGLSAIAGCQSHYDNEVKSSYHSQWTTVAANTQQTTDAAQAVLNDQGLKNVKASATNLDGKASGKMADGTEVTVSVKKQAENQSQVSVNVGSVGDPQVGANIAKRVKERAESH